MILLANGCSHTSGAEIEYIRQDSCYEKAWPKYLSDKLNLNCKNIAISGASNKRVLRTTINTIGELFLQKVRSKDIFVVILWPGSYRTEVYQNKFKDIKPWYGWIPLVVGNDDVYKKQYSRAIYQYYQNWVTTTLDPKAVNIDYYTSVILLQGYLKSFKIKYLFWRASATTLNKENLPLTIQIDRKYFPSVHDDTLDYLSILKNSGFTFSMADSSHFGEDGHIFFADYLHKYIEENLLWN
tara:strand:+ start:31153 stop:31872 length:720 start_codon:yes stop_codon:yes gene_type:complete